MAQQIVITSLEKTLTGGSGYGLAGASPNIPDPIRKRVLSLAGYGFVRRTPSPVNWVGFRLETVSGSIAVLGRIGEAPNDYSGRDNFLGHFLLIQPSEMATFHPGQILDRFSWISSWTGPARALEAPRLPPGSPAYPGLSSPWELVTGDRGFAGAPWDCLDGSGKFLFVHDQLDADRLKAMLVETLSMAPNQRAWNLSFTTHAEDFAEAPKCVIQGTHAYSRLAQKWDLDRISHFALPNGSSSPSLVAPTGPAVAQARKQLPLLPEIRQTRTTQPRNRSAELFLNSEALPESIQAPLPFQPPPAPLPVEPWRMLFPGVLGFFLGLICTAVPFSLALISMIPTRDKEVRPNPNGAGPGKGNEQKIAKEKELEKGDPNPGKKQGNPDNGAVDPGQPKNPIMANLPIEPAVRFFGRPLQAVSAMAELFRLPDATGGPKDQWIRQSLVLSRLQTLQGWNADERTLLRPDRFFILVRQLELEKPPLPDPFTHQHLDQMKTPTDEVAWLMEGSRLLKSPKKEATLALLSFIANQNRIQGKCDSISQKVAEKDPKKDRLDPAFWRDNLEMFKKKLAKEDFEALNANFPDALKARLDEMKESLEKYKNP